MVACAECQRLRLQCDRRVPCQSCMRRGCQHLCPDGMGVTAQGSRVILAVTKPLHDTVKELRDRIRALETALNDIHLERTGHTHPLLRTTAVDQDLEDPTHLDTVEETPNPMQKPALVRGRDGSLRLASAISKLWITHSVAEGNVTQSIPGIKESSRPHGYPRRHLRHLFFPLPTPAPANTLPILQRQIPTNEVVDALVDMFHQAIGTTGIIPAFSDKYIQGTIIPNARSSSGSLQTSTTLALLFAILAIGSLFAIEGDETPEVDLYAELSTEALALSQVMAAPSIETAEALCLRAWLEFLRQGSSEEQARLYLAMAGQTCLALGLHRDGAQFGLRLEVVEKRRIVFWMIYRIDVWQSLCIGRPSRFGFGIEFIDTEAPGTELPKAIHPDLTHNFDDVARLIATIAQMTISLKAPNYQEMLDMDERVRALGERWKPTMPAALPVPSILLIYLHRAFYARALIQDTEDLLKSSYSYSVQATLHSARDILKWAQGLVHRSTAMCARYHWIWNMAITAATIYKLMLDHSPQCVFAEQALEGLSAARQLFHLGCRHGSGRARQALTIFSEQTSGKQTWTPQRSRDADGIDASHSSAETAPIDSNATSGFPRDSTVSAAHLGRTKHVTTHYVQHRKQIQVLSRENTDELTQEHQNSGPLPSTTVQTNWTSSTHPEPANVRYDAHVPTALDSTYTLWNGYKWTDMDQGPKELSVIAGSMFPITQVDGSISWSTDTGALGPEPSLLGSLNGEWISAYYG